MDEMTQIATLPEMYQYICQKGPAHRQHAMAVKQLAQRFATVVELGGYGLESGFGILYGLSENPSPSRSFLSIDTNAPPWPLFNKATEWAKEAGIEFQFQQDDDFEIQLDPVDVLSIDSHHTYRHLTFELETYSPMVRSAIVMHDTSPPWGYIDQNEEDHPLLESLYPVHIDRKKRGLWAAVVDFLEKHKEWELLYRQLQNPGVTVIRRVI